ncbi:MAG TPA: phosphate ABC transporter permease PstA [Acidimicrobiales bacterium]|nr:phosphate ABC transporter permease PstA [Acidimicrobiales bacterium]
MTSVLEAPAGKSTAYYERRALIQASARGTLQKRRRIALAIRIVFGACMVLTLVPLVALIAYVTKRGVGALSVAFFTHTPTPAGVPGGGISNAIVGSLILNGLALVIAMPIGLLVALLLIERRGPIPNAIRFGADVLSGIPSILTGLFAFSVIVVHTHYSAYSASVALAVLMLPIMIRGDEEAMRTVPNELWEAGLALGAPQSRVVRSVVVRGSIPGLVTANLLALARAVGETAPLLFTAIGSQLFSTSLGQPINAIPIVIYQDGTTAFKDLQTDAWGAAFVLMVGVLILSIIGRVFAARLTRKSK